MDLCQINDFVVHIPTLGTTMVHDCTTNNGANTKLSLPLSEPPLEIDIINVSTTAVMPPCMHAIHPSPEELLLCMSLPVAELDGIAAGYHLHGTVLVLEKDVECQ